MLAPKVEARLLQGLAIQPHEKVLEVGTGSGYGTALAVARLAYVLRHHEAYLEDPWTALDVRDGGFDPWAGPPLRSRHVLSKLLKISKSMPQKLDRSQQIFYIQN